MSISRAAAFLAALCALVACTAAFAGTASAATSSLVGDKDDFGFGSSGVRCMFFFNGGAADLGIFDDVKSNTVAWTQTIDLTGVTVDSAKLRIREWFTDDLASTVTIDGVSSPLAASKGVSLCVAPKVQEFTVPPSALADGKLEVTVARNGDSIALDWSQLVLNGEDPGPDIAPQDQTGPVTAISLAGTEGSNGWHTSAVTPSATGTDETGGSGVAATRCVVDPATAPTSFSDIPSGSTCSQVSGAGSHTVYAASKDNAGNAGTVVSQSFKIDRSAPTLTVGDVVANATGPDGATVDGYDGVSATDATSGVSTVCTPAAPHLFAIGDTTVSCTATNGAGLATTKTFTAHVKGAAEQVDDLIAAQGTSGLDRTVLKLTAQFLRNRQTSMACGEIALITATNADAKRVQDVLACSSLNPVQIFVSGPRVTVVVPGQPKVSVPVIQVPTLPVIQIPGLSPTTSRAVMRSAVAVADAKATTRKAAKKKAKKKLRKRAVRRATRR